MSGEQDEHLNADPPPDEIERHRSAARQAMDSLNTSNRLLTEALMLPRTGKLTDDQTTRVIAQYKTYIHEKAISASQVAKEAGYSASVLSSWSDGTYKGKRDSVTFAINAWLERDARRQLHRKAKDYVKTDVAEDIRSVCLMADQRTMMAAIVVPAGAGKTKLLKALTQEMNGVYIYCSEDVTSRDLYRNIAVAVGWKRESGTRGELLRFIIERLTGSKRVIFVDEAHNAGKHIGCLRSIYDQAQVPIVMAGTEEILKHVNDRSHGRGQFASRCIRYNIMDYVNNAEGPDGADKGRDLFTIEEITAFFAMKGIRIDRDGLQLLWALACLPNYGTLRLIENTVDTVVGFNAGVNFIRRDDIITALQSLMGGDAFIFRSLRVITLTGRHPQAWLAPDRAGVSMAWTNKQKQIAVMSCRAAGITEDQRTDMILRNFANAHHWGDITSRSPKLTGHDFEAFMAIVERYAGGKVLHYTEGFWKHAAADRLKRMRFKAFNLAAALEAAGKLQPNGIGLSGWITKRVSEAASRVEQLEYHGLLVLILGLRDYAKQNGIETEPIAVAG